MNHVDIKTPLQKIDANLAEVFECSPMVVTELPPVEQSSLDTLDDPVDEVQENIKGLIKDGKSALEYALELAKASDSPRAFEVVGALLKHLSDMNMQLLDAHDKKVKFRKPKEEPASQPGIVNNSIIFNGSTSDFNRMIEQMRSK